MLIAHLPAGYLLSRPLAARARAPQRLVVAAALFGSVFPDVDLVRCYLIDGGRVPHHAYWTHIPLAWAVIAAVLLGATALFRRPDARDVAVAFFVGVLSHLLLDSVAAGIAWLYPFDDRFLGLVHVPRTHAFWVLNLLTHWTFGLELAICASAAVAWVRRARRPPLVIVRAPIVIDPSRRYSDLLVIRGDGRSESPAGMRLRPR